LHQARRIDYSLGAEEIETPQFVVIAEHTPRRFLRRASLDRQLSEARKFIRGFHFRTLIILPSTQNGLQTQSAVAALSQLAVVWQTRNWAESSNPLCSANESFSVYGLAPNHRNPRLCGQFRTACGSGEWCGYYRGRDRPAPAILLERRPRDRARLSPA